MAEKDKDDNAGAESVAEYLSPNDKLDEKGNVVPQDASVIGENILRMLAGPEDTRRVTGYKVAATWETYSGQKPPHQIGDTVKYDDVEVPEGMTTPADKENPRGRKVTRENFVASLVAKGLLIPQYAGKDKEPEADAAPANPGMTPGGAFRLQGRGAPVGLNVPTVDTEP